MSAPPREFCTAWHRNMEASSRALLPSQRTRWRAMTRPRSFDCKEQQSQDDKPSFLYSALVSARDAHIFPVLRDRSASDLDALRLQKASDLLVRQRPGRIFFFDKLFHPALEDEQRSVASLGTVHAFAEKVP